MSTTVTWSEPGDGGGAEKLTGYFIERISNVDNGTNNVDGFPRKFTIKNLMSNAKYFITVAAITEEGNKGDVSEKEEAITSKSIKVITLVLVS